MHHPDIKADIMHHAERLNMLPNSHFGGRPRRSTTDALHLPTKYIKDAWRKGLVVSALFLDVKGAFPSVSATRLVHNMRMKGIPREYAEWVGRKLKGRKTVIKFDDFTSEWYNIDNGCG